MELESIIGLTVFILVALFALILVCVIGVIEIKKREDSRKLGKVRDIYNRWSKDLSYNGLNVIIDIGLALEGEDVGEDKG